MNCDCPICNVSTNSKRSMLEALMGGSSEYAIVDSIVDASSFSTDTDKIYRGTVKLLSTGGVQECDFSPSPYGGVIPREGDLITVYRKPGYFCRFSDVVSTPVPVEKSSLQERTESPTDAIEIPVLTKGEMFLGLDARLLFDDQGGASLSTRSGSLSVSLNNSIKEVLVQGFNFELFTPGNGIRIRTESSIPDTFGDTIRIEKNVPIPVVPPELASVVPLPIPSNISLFQIDSLGGISISALTDSASIGLSENGIAGYAYFKNLLSGLQLTPVGGVTLSNNFGRLDIDSVGSLELSSPLASLKQDVLGNQRLTGKTVELFATDLVKLTSFAGPIFLDGTTLITLQAPITRITGDLLLGGAGGSVSTATGPINLIAPAYTLTSPLVVFTGNTEVNGTATFLGTIIPTGLAASIPLISQTTVAKIPVLVNGVIAGFIPVIP